MSQPAAPRGFIASLFHATDPGADSLVLGGMVLLAALIAMSAYDVVVNARAFSAVEFGTAGAAILAGLGGGKKLRDGSGNAGS